MGKNEKVKYIPKTGFAFFGLSCVTYWRMYQDTKRWKGYFLLFFLAGPFNLANLIFGLFNVVNTIRVNFMMLQILIFILQWGAGIISVLKFRKEYWMTFEMYGTDISQRDEALRERIRKETNMKEPLETDLSADHLRKIKWPWLALPMFAWAGFGYATGKAHVNKYMKWMAVYLLMLCCFLLCMIVIPYAHDRQGWFSDSFMMTVLPEMRRIVYLIWLASIIHSFSKRKEYLLYREAYEKIRPGEEEVMKARVMERHREKNRRKAEKKHSESVPEETVPVSKALVGKEVQKPLSGRAVDVKPDRSVQKIDINRCGEEELAKLPGINAILAKKAIGYRDEKGEFQSVEELIDLLGVKPHMAVQILKMAEAVPVPKDDRRKHTGRVLDI